MNLVNLDHVGHDYGTRQVLDDVSLGVAVGARVGVVGRNGGGKSTLARILAGRQQPARGRVTHRGDVRVGHLAQSDDLDDDALVRTVVSGGRHGHDLAGTREARLVMRSLLGAEAPDQSPLADSRIRSLSGGERRRVSLAAVLAQDLDLLILDEPTNHLDIETVAALAGLLGRRRSALVVVTHDRWFLDEVCDRTWEVADGAVHEYDGGYAAYVLARAERERVAAGDEERRRNRLRKELAWLRRGPPARTSKPRFRVEAANALVADVPPPRDTTELVRVAGARLGKVVVELTDLTVTVGGRRLLDSVTWHLGPGDRVGILGPNGAGKTTLLDVLAGGPTPHRAEAYAAVVVEGRRVLGQTVRLGRLEQDQVPVAPEVRVLTAVTDVAASITLADGRELGAAQLLERLGFGRDRQWVAMGDLSGGERRRVQLLRTLLGGPNVLLLDEPTNDLDTESLAALEDVLDGWPGTLVVVSHDRYFVERTTDRQWALRGDGRLTDLPGGVDQYLALGPASSTAPPVAAAGSRAGPPATDAGAGAAAAAAAATSRTPSDRSAAATRTARKEMARLERTLGRLSQREQRVHEEMAERATDPESLRRLAADLDAIATERAETEDAWLEAAEAAEGAGS